MKQSLIYKRRLCSFLVMLILSKYAVNAYDFYIGDIYYSYNSNNQSLIVVPSSDQNEPNCYIGRKSIIIPDSVTCNGRKLPVKGIGSRAFKGCYDLKSIIFPSCLENIDYEAFCLCSSLESINLPPLNSIEQDAFRWSGLTSLTLSCKNIGYRAFTDCSNLSYVKLLETTYISPEAFLSCKSLKTLILPGSLTSIGSNAFVGCDSVEVLTLEDGANIIYYEDNTTFGSMKPKYAYIGRLRRDNSGGCDFHYSIAFQDSAILTLGKYVVRKNSRPGLNFSVNFFQKVYAMNTEPTEVDVIFDNSTYINGTLFVPTGTKDKFMTAEGWKNFFNIEEINIEDMWNGQGEIPDNPNPDPNPDPNYLKCDVNGDGEVNIADVNTVLNAILGH